MTAGNAVQNLNLAANELGNLIQRSDGDLLTQAATSNHRLQFSKLITYDAMATSSPNAKSVGFPSGRAYA